MSPVDPLTGGERTLLLVAGSGRSGTSLFTGLTHELGMHIPQPEVAADESNPRGFGEPRWTVDFHNQLLRSVDVTPEDARPRAWEITADVAGRPRVRRRLEDWLGEQLASSDRIVVKDPRITWFLPLYRDVGAGLGVEPRIVTMLRHPAATIKSRQLAYGTGSSDIRRLVGWLNMMLFLELRTRDLPRAMVRYDDLLADWSGTLSRSEPALGVPLVSGASDAQRRGADALVDPSLRRAAPDWSALDVPADLRELADAAHSALCRVAVPDGEGPTTAQNDTRAALDEARSAYECYYSLAESVTRSSIVAARAAERRKAKAQAKTEAKAQAKAATRTSALASTRSHERGAATALLARVRRAASASRPRRSRSLTSQARKERG